MTIYLGDNPVFRGHEEIQPATSSRIGGVKPDGTTISVANDGTASVIAGSLDNRILPDGYTITVATDGTGDFTDIQSALDSLQGKSCAGVVTVQLKAGDTFNVSSTITSPIHTGITNLYIVSSVAQSPAYIVSNTTRVTLNVQYDSPMYVYLKDLNITGSGTSITNSTAVLNYSYAGTLFAWRTTVSNAVWGFASESGSRTRISNSTSANCTNGLVSNFSHMIVSAHTFTNCTTAVTVNNSGIIQTQSTYTASNVTNKFNKTANTVTNAGLIISAW